MKVRTKRKNKNIYRSGLESTFAAKTKGMGFIFEPERMPYTVHRKYVPDFVKENILIECKGFFRAGDTLKYKSVKESYPDKELIFILSDPFKKVRKGSKLNMGQWCFKENFAFFTVKDCDKLKVYISLSKKERHKYRQEYLRGT
tara:strand:+ start:6039 stop:6470 length:432 start_codon:yes stop_codon:yes gene_type:complete